MNDTQTIRLTRRQAVEFLRNRGYPISLSLFNKLAMPAVGQGPRVDVLWGRRPRPLYRPDDLIAWAEGRCRPGSQAA